jgi:hypothetical protein
MAQHVHLVRSAMCQDSDCALEALGKTDIRFDRRGVVGHRFEETTWLKSRQSPWTRSRRAGSGLAAAKVIETLGSAPSPRDRISTRTLLETRPQSTGTECIFTEDVRAATEGRRRQYCATDVRSDTSRRSRSSADLIHIS